MEMDKGLTFREDINKQVDFVLVWEEQDDDPDGEEKTEKRKIFQTNLEKEGLELEVETTEGSALNFLKIHAPMEVLKRYAEILKLKMPIRKCMHEIGLQNLEDHAEKAGAEGEDILEFKLTQGDSLETRSSVIETKELSATAIYSREKEYLFDHQKKTFFSSLTRSQIIEFILKRKRFSDNLDADFSFGIERLIRDKTYVANYPLHDGTLKTPNSNRNFLSTEWATLKRSFNYQPLDDIKDYYGIKIALYFAWLGFYNIMLIIPSIVGILCFIYGVSTMHEDTTSDEICEGAMGNVTMCPICDHFCEYWNLKDSCLYYRVRYLFDNETTVFFGIFMSIWAAFFLEMWKRYSAEIKYKWNVIQYDQDEEHPRPEYLEILKRKNVQTTTINFVTGTEELKPPFWRMKFPGLLISISSVIFLIGLALSAVFSVVLYRMSMIVALAAVQDDTIKGNWSIFISITGGILNLILLQIFNLLYECFAVWVTEKELPRTRTTFDNSLAIKIYFLKFVNYYGSIFYIAFMKGHFVGTPNHYNRWGNYRQEECSPGGCFMELCIQLMVIFVGKQFFFAVMEYYLPLFWQVLNMFKLQAWKEDDDSTSPQYVQDFELVEWGHTGLFYEYLEMVLQYGFITIFVTAFPLAPFFALANNIFELRFDARKLLRMHRRPVAQKVSNIGIWFDIMETLGGIAVITNALIIAITSDFIPKQVYKYVFSESRSYDGYANFSLSYLNTSDFDKGADVAWNKTDVTEPEFCRYPAYRNPPWETDKYAHANTYWIIMGARLLFIVLFQNLVFVITMTAKWIIPDVPQKLKDKMRREAFITNEIIIRTERRRTKGMVTAKGMIESKKKSRIQVDSITEGAINDTQVESKPTTSIIRDSTGGFSNQTIVNDT